MAYVRKPLKVMGGEFRFWFKSEEGEVWLGSNGPFSLTVSKDKKSWTAKELFKQNSFTAGTAEEAFEGLLARVEKDANDTLAMVANMRGSSLEQALDRA